MHAFNCALRAQIAGDIEQAEQLATEALQIGTDGGQPDANLFYSLQVSAVSCDRGTLGELVPLLEQICRRHSRPAPSVRIGGAGGGPCRSRPHRRRRVASWRRSPPPTSTIRWTQVWMHRHDAVRRRRHRMPGPEVRRAAVRPARSLSRSVACTGVSVGAPSATTSAASPPSSAATTKPTPTSPKPPRSTTEPTPSSHAARTNLYWGTMLAERNAPGDNERARDLLTEAHAAAVAHGYANIERRAAEALQHLA